MINSKKLLNILVKNDFKFITGIPCSILKDFLNCLNDNRDKIKHIIPTSEEEAMGIAAGYYLATSKIPMVYMQNSGFANSVDGLTSLLNKEVYKIPVLLLISWRGEPGKKDEPQHIKIGKITLKLLKLLGIPYTILSNKDEIVTEQIKKAKEVLYKNSFPYALIIKKGLIEPYQTKNKRSIYPMTREKAIKIIIDNLRGNEVIISTTGKASRELFEYREIKKQSHKTDFHVLGSMGCAASIGFGIAIQEPEKKVIIFDGDGSILMKMGTLATVGHYLPKNFYHIIFDNNSHDSTGGQRTVSDTVDFRKIAIACGYKKAEIVTNENKLKEGLTKINDGPSMLVIKVKKGARKNLGRPTKTPIESKKEFMNFLLK